MSANRTVPFIDVNVGHFQKRTLTIAEPSNAVQSDSVIADISDGVFILEVMFANANLSRMASQFAIGIFSLLGDTAETLWKFDEEIAKELDCSSKTIQRGRKALITESQIQNFYPVRLTEAKWERDQNRYTRTGYGLNQSLCNALIAALRAGQADPDYTRDRLGALRRAAERFYEDVEEAPPKTRKDKPRRAITALSHLERAVKAVETAEETLKQTPERARKAFINGNIEALQATADQLRAKLAEFEAQLAVQMQAAENKEVSHKVDKVSTTPQSGETGCVAVLPVIQEETDTTDETEHTPEDKAAFDKVLARFGKPAVTRSNLDVFNPDMGLPADESPPPELIYEPDPVPFFADDDPRTNF